MSDTLEKMKELLASLGTDAPQYGSYIIDKDYTTALRETEDYLRAEGWKTRKTYSRCAVAAAEAYLEKDGVIVDLVASSFLGSFVEIEIYKRVR